MSPSPEVVLLSSITPTELWAIYGSSRHLISSQDNFKSTEFSESSTWCAFVAPTIWIVTFLKATEPNDWWMLMLSNLKKKKFSCDKIHNFVLILHDCEHEYA